MIKGAGVGGDVAVDVVVLPEPASTKNLNFRDCVANPATTNASLAQLLISRVTDSDAGTAPDPLSVDDPELSSDATEIGQALTGPPLRGRARSRPAPSARVGRSGPVGDAGAPRGGPCRLRILGAWMVFGALGAPSEATGRVSRWARRRHVARPGSDDPSAGPRRTSPSIEAGFTDPVGEARPKRLEDPSPGHRRVHGRDGSREQVGRPGYAGRQFHGASKASTASPDPTSLGPLIVPGPQSSFVPSASVMVIAPSTGSRDPA